MSRRVRFPLMARMLVWLCVHLAVLAAAFALFVAWQLRLGLDSLLSGTAGERLRGLGEEVASDLRAAPRSGWPELLREREKAEAGTEVRFFLHLAPGQWIGNDPGRLPGNVADRVREFRRPEGRPGRGGPRPGPPGRGPRPGPDGDFPPGDGPPPLERQGRPAIDGTPRVRPDFLVRGDGGDGYWAGIDLPLFEPGRGAPPVHGLLLVRSPDITGGGWFFDLRPWLLGGLTVLALSLALWAPVFFGITRALRRLARATEAIADGKFDSPTGLRRSDELGALGESIDTMAGRLDRLVRGQKRFLGDVAHELCSPLARIRTGLGVMEESLPPDGDGRARLASIDEDVAELSQLVSEVLAFTRASTAPGSVRLEAVRPEPLVRIALSRECPELRAEVAVPEDLAVLADRHLLSRAIANVLRNAARHGGERCTLRVGARAAGDRIELRFADDGPGVSPEDLPRLFEPFYRPDAARTREAGGSGLGLAIVSSAIEACGGTVHAEMSAPSGLCIIFRLAAAAGP